MKTRVDIYPAELQTETVNRPRRRVFGIAAMMVAAAQLGVIASAAGQSGKAASKVPAINRVRTHPSSLSSRSTQAF